MKAVMGTLFKVAADTPTLFVQLVSPLNAQQTVRKLMFAPGGGGGLGVRLWEESDLPDDPLLEGRCAVELLGQVCSAVYAGCAETAGCNRFQTTRLSALYLWHCYGRC